MAPTKWDPDQYFEKAKRYIARALRPTEDPDERPFWFSLALEHLCRAALCSVSPALNADPLDEGSSILYALGFQGKTAPKAIPMHAVLPRLEQVFAEFTKDDRTFAEGFIFLRNEELHSSTLPFDGLREAKWLPRYYQVCGILCKVTGHKLVDLLGPDETKTAEGLIGAHKQQVQAKLKETLKNHRAVFAAKPEEERESLAQPQREPTSWGEGKQEFTCPACDTKGNLIGTRAGESEPYLRDYQIFTRVTYHAKSFKCRACGLSLSTVAELLAVNADPVFFDEEDVDLHDVFQRDYEEDYFNM